MTKILIVDDDEFNLDILDIYLQRAGYETVLAQDGLIALQKLEENPDIDLVVFDRMMPNMNGMQLLEQLQKHETYRHLPTIMQTASAASYQVLEGIKAGVYYYLTKPYSEAVLISIVEAALRNCHLKNRMQEKVRDQYRILGLMENSSFRFRTMEEAQALAYYLANCFPDPEAVIYGLRELLVNAIEHGNLGLSYHEKKTLILAGDWLDEIDRRLKSPDYNQKFATIDYRASPDEITVIIKDQGQGFDWHNYLEFTSERATDPNGRGIATSRIMSFDSVEYLGAGNEVVCKVFPKQPLS